MGDLDSLLEALELHRKQLSQPTEGWPDESFSKGVPRLPLFHRLGEPLRDAEGSLASHKIVLELARPKAARAAIGTDACVFASFGVAAYLQPAVVLAFGPAEQQRESRLSLPWDSRGAAARLGWSDEVASEKIARYSLAAPNDESYLARHLATCFQTWEQFLSGKRPLAPDPDEARVLGWALDAPADVDLAPLTTPEARFLEPQPVGETLLAVFVDADFPDSGPRSADWRRTYTVLRRIVEQRKPARFEAKRRMKPGPALARAAASFVLEHLGVEP